MSQDDKYFQCPISILRSKWTNTETLCQAIINVSLVGLSQRDVPAIADKMHHMVERFCDRNDREIPDDETVYRFLAAAEFLDVSIASDDLDIAYLVDDINKRYVFAATSFRLRTDLLWAAIAEDWPVNRLKVLLGIYAGIGSNQYQWMAHSKVAALAAGYTGLNDAAENGNVGCMTVAAVRWWADYLHEAGFVQLILAGKGQKRIYSNKHESDQNLADQYTAQMKKRKKLIAV